MLIPLELQQQYQVALKDQVLEKLQDAYLGQTARLWDQISPLQTF